MMKLAFSLESWEACGGDRDLSGRDALRQGNVQIDAALAIFKEVRKKETFVSVYSTAALFVDLLIEP